MLQISPFVLLGRRLHCSDLMAIREAGEYKDQHNRSYGKPMIMGSILMRHRSRQAFSTTNTLNYFP